MYYGFLIILLAWLWQWYKFNQGHRSIEPWFLRLSALGFLVVTLDTFNVSNWLTWANLLILLTIVLLVLKVRR